MNIRLRSTGFLGVFLVLLTACSSSTGALDTDESSGDAETVTEEESSDEATDVASDGLDVDLFFDGAFAEDVTTEDCTLSGGVEHTCYRIMVAGYPANREVGPFCPSSLTDDAEAGGIWFDGEQVYDVDGDFIASLAEIYGDGEWRLHDDDGNVYVIDSADGFEAAARPDVAEEYQNHCVEGRLEWLENGQPVTSTVLIPTEPVAADNPSETRGTRGVTLDGVVIAESAPVDAILGAYTIAAFDDCGGHFNPTEGYHMHGLTGCSERDVASEDESAVVGYAMDGYAIHSATEGVELDECNGHSTEDEGYHYHANSVEKNDVLPCLVGQTVAGEQGDGRPGGNGPAR